MFRDIIKSMEAIECLPKLVGINENITAVTRLELCLGVNQVDVGVLEAMRINYKIERSYITLQLKAILDTGTEINIGSEKRMGKFIIDHGRHTSIVSVLNKKR